MQSYLPAIGLQYKTHISFELTYVHQTERPRKGRCRVTMVSLEICKFGRGKEKCKQN